eukprot:1626902-Alexandrium_andersonii.AAC.1
MCIRDSLGPLQARDAAAGPRRGGPRGLGPPLQARHGRDDGRPASPGRVPPGLPAGAAAPPPW